MSLIEGVGDEVTNFMVVMMVIIIGIFSWWSTSITEQPLIRTVLILEPHNRHRSVGSVRAPTVTPSASGEDTGQSEPGLAERSHGEPVSESVNQIRVSNQPKLVHSANESSGESSTDPGPGSSTQPASTSTSLSTDSIPELSSMAIEATGSSDHHDSGKNELRRRRLQFFQDRQDTPSGERRDDETLVQSDISVDGQENDTDDVENSSETQVQNKYCNESLSEGNIPSGGMNGKESVVPHHDSKYSLKNSAEKLRSDVPSSEECSSNSTEDAQGTCLQGVANEKSNLRSVPQSDETSRNMDGIRIRLKYLNDNQKLVQGKLQEPLGDFKRRHFALEMEGNKVVRLIFNGQVLHSDDQTLQNYGLFDNCVVHCLVITRRTTTASADATPNTNNSEDISGGLNAGGAPRDWDLSHLLYIALSGVLIMTWILRFSNPHLFSAASTVALFGLTGLFIIFIVGIYIPDTEGLRT